MKNMKKIIPLFLLLVLCISCLKMNVFANDDTDMVEAYENNVISQIITDGMSDYDKLVAITKYTAQTFSYSPNYSSSVSLIKYGEGDCWANNGFVYDLLEKVGIEAKIRTAIQDEGAGSGHKNVVAYIDGKYYVADAGFDGTAPRLYSIDEETYGFSMDGTTAYQYDGFKSSSVTVPGFVTKLGYDDGKVFGYSSEGLKEINIPASVTSISYMAFAECEDLMDINVDENNPYYTSVDGVLYDKNVTTLLCIPGGRSSFSLPKTVTTIGKDAFCYCSKFTEINIPDGILKIETGAFDYCMYLTKIYIPKSVKEIDDPKNIYCFTLKDIIVDADNPYFASVDGILYNKDLTKVIRVPNRRESVSLPDSVTTIGRNSFEYCIYMKEVTFPDNVTTIEKEAFAYATVLEKVHLGTKVELIETNSFNVSYLQSFIIESPNAVFQDNALPSKMSGTIYGLSGSTAESYANNNGITFKIYGQDHVVVTDPAVPATCTQAGKTEGSHCSLCGQIFKAQTTIPMTDHAWSVGYITKYATESEEGLRTYYCGICGAIKVETIPRLSSSEESYFYDIPGTTLVSAKNTKGKKLTIKWKKNSYVDGYLIQMSTSKSFTSGVIQKYVYSNQTVTFKSPKLKKKKTYYVRVCTYKAVSGQICYSDWSNVKKVKIKK